MDFGDAIRALKAGDLVRRAGWNGRNMHVGLQLPVASAQMTMPFLYMKTAQDEMIPWTVSQADALATDWEIVEDQTA